MTLLEWALVAFVIAVIAAVLGYGGIARGASSIARVFFMAFLVVAGILLLMQLIG